MECTVHTATFLTTQCLTHDACVDVKGVSDYLPTDKIAPAWETIIACLPGLCDKPV